MSLSGDYGVPNPHQFALSFKLYILILPRLAFYIRAICVNFPKYVVLYNLFSWGLLGTGTLITSQIHMHAVRKELMNTTDLYCLQIPI